jgi:DNA-binding protein Fis
MFRLVNLQSQQVVQIVQQLVYRLFIFSYICNPFEEPVVSFCIQYFLGDQTVSCNLMFLNRG